MIINPENICSCGEHKGSCAKTCFACANGEDKPYVPPAGRAGRPIKYSDKRILEAIAGGAHTLDTILAALGMHSKSNLMRRLRVLREGGHVRIIERARRDGFTILPGEGLR